MNRFDIGRCQVSHNLSNPSRYSRKLLVPVSLLVTLLDGQHIRESFSVACLSDSEILAAHHSRYSSRNCSSYPKTSSRHL